MLIIFDLDGTLVDSETLSAQAFLDLLPGLAGAGVHELALRFRGRKLTEIFADIEGRTGAALPSDFEKTYRRRVAELFVDLQPMAGVPEMLEALPYERCIASSGPPAKIEHALEVTGLRRYFGDRLYSSHVIGSWKPEPGLFLHAAAEMGFPRERCVVVEDSPVGVEAGRAAGMRVLQYAPEEPAADGRFRCYGEFLNLL